MINHASGVRIFVLGAGFSRPADLPLGNELYSAVRQRIENNVSPRHAYHLDLKKYISFEKKVNNIKVSEDDFDLERLLSFLDIEHFLGLKGGDTFSSEGNETQIKIKIFIGQILNELTPHASDLPDLYHEFARNLNKNDIVVTFNYDTILEKALDHIGKSYKLFPHRFSEVRPYYNTVDDSHEEITILKMHGSLDWFNTEEADISEEDLGKLGQTRQADNKFFINPEKFGAEKLVEGPRPNDDKLSYIVRIRKVDQYYQEDFIRQAPFILSPSSMKILYSSIFSEFWSSLAGPGESLTGINIIGFSLPEHDYYIKAALFRLVNHFLGPNWQKPFFGIKKSKINLIDFRKDISEQKIYKSSYSFIDSEKANFHFDGFSTEALDLIFRGK